MWDDVLYTSCKEDIEELVYELVKNYIERKKENPKLKVDRFLSQAFSELRIIEGVEGLIVEYKGKTHEIFSAKDFKKFILSHTDFKKELKEKLLEKKKKGKKA